MLKIIRVTGDQPWDFSGRNDAKAETPVLWPPHVKNWLIGKDSDAARDWGQEEKGATEDEMAGWHHGLDGCESEWTPGVGDGQGGLACCNSWGHKEPDTTEQLNWTELNRGRDAIFPGTNPTMSSSVIPFSSCPQSFPISGSFPMSQLFASGGQNIGALASTAVFPMNTQELFPLGWTGWISLQSKGLSSIFSNTTVQKHQFLSAQLSS